jgi:hypothetical protein
VLLRISFGVCADDGRRTKGFGTSAVCVCVGVGGGRADASAAKPGCLIRDPFPVPRCGEGGGRRVIARHVPQLAMYRYRAFNWDWDSVCGYGLLSVITWLSYKSPLPATATPRAPNKGRREKKKKCT